MTAAVVARSQGQGARSAHAARGVAICVRPTHERGALDEAGGGVLRPGGLALTERALGYCALGAGARVLDLGCGTGVTVRHLRGALGFCAVGVDRSQEALGRGPRAGAVVPLVRASGSDLPLADGSVAAVLAECSLSVTAEVGHVLAECRRVLVAQGRLAVSDLYARAACEAAPLRALPVACGVGMTTRMGLARRLEEHGFRIDLWEDHSALLAQFAARLVMAGGSPREVWVRPDVDQDEERRIADAVRRARPGYFLLVATKCVP